MEWDYLPPPNISEKLKDAVVHSQNVIPNLPGIRCEECGLFFKTEATFKHHRLGGHIGKAGKIIIKPGRSGNQKFELAMYVDLEATKIILQLAYIPWFSVDENGEERLENVSVGVTSFADVTFYARNAWSQIRSGMANGDVYLHGCGGGRGVAMRLNWFMKPELAKPLNLFFFTDVVGSKVKGFARELLESVHVLSASDEFGHLADCHVHIVDEIKKAVVNMADSNVSAFFNNLSQSNRTVKDFRKMRDYLVYLVDQNNALNGIL